MKAKRKGDGDDGEKEEEGKEEREDGQKVVIKEEWEGEEGVGEERQEGPAGWRRASESVCEWDSIGLTR